ncbi:DUF2057 family protein [Vibrio sp.]|nr:DUF2057 family protein [Vibrio sp.]
MSTLNTMTIAALSGLLSTLSYADISLDIPENVELYTINGVDAEQDNGTFTLPNGEIQIVFRATTNVGRGKHRESFESDVWISTFTETNKAITLNIPTYNNAKEAKTGMDNLTWELNDSQGYPIQYKKDELKKEGFQLGRNYQHEITLYNLNQLGPAAISINNAAIQQLNTATNSAATNQQVVEKQLQYWYDKASPETKARFKSSIQN